jgi:hypothetical protein
VRWLLAPATITTLLLAIPSRGAGHVWLQNRPFDLPMTAAIVTVVVVFACLYLGWRKARTLAGALGAVVIGAASAAAFFLLFPVAGERAVWAGWLAGWLVLSVLQSLLDGHLRPGKALGRGMMAAAAVAVCLVIAVGQLSAAAAMTAPGPANLPVFGNFLAWALAFAPGATLLMRR